MTGARAVRAKVHKVGLTAALLGLPALVFLPFATLKASRIHTGEDLSVVRSLEPWQVAILVAVWVAVGLLSLRDDRRVPMAVARGLAASAAIVASAWLSGAAALRLAEEAGGFARVSIGGGVWASVLAAYAVVLSARREVGAGGWLGSLVGAAAPVGVVALLVTGRLDGLGIMREYANQADRFWAEAGNHVTFSVAAVVLAVLVGVALGVAAFRWPRSQRPVFASVNVLQTIPGLAMIGLLVAPLAGLSRTLPWLREIGFGGLGWGPVVLALTLYALLPIVRNTYAGLRGVPEEVTDAGRGMGMSGRQLTTRVRLPIAAPVLTSGVRVSAVQTVGNATLGAFAAAGTMGLFVFGGLAQQSPDLIMLGSIGVVVLALVADGVMRLVQRALSPRRARMREVAR